MRRTAPKAPDAVDVDGGTWDAVCGPLLVLHEVSEYELCSDGFEGEDTEYEFHSDVGTYVPKRHPKPL